MTRGLSAQLECSLMATIPRTIKPAADEGENGIPPLEPGDHLDQKTFHERYEAMPADVRAELIGGTVFLSSPLKKPHGRTHKLLIRWVDEYEEATPGTEAFDNASTILDPEAEPQPGADGILRSEVFAGLWLDPAAVLRLDRQRILEVLRQGLTTPEHAAFVARLATP